MTLLATIDGHVLHLFCKCGHQKGLEVSELLKNPKLRGATIHNVRAKARCAGCGRLGSAELRIVFSPPTVEQKLRTERAAKKIQSD